MNLERFKTPAPIYRPAPFWSWNDKLDKNELKRQIGQMADKGWGGYFMHSRVGLVTGYLSPEWMEMIRTCAEEAKSTETYAWLYDEDKWPSGFAGGKVSSKSQYRNRALVLLKENELMDNDTVLLKFEMQGSQYYICKRVSPLGNLWFNGTSYVDLMNPEAVKTFIECTHERYKETCGEYFGKEIPGIFTDEPCYLMYGHYSVPALPWSDYLPDFFRDLKGYSIEDHLPQLFFKVQDYQKIRFDFFDAATRLFIESFTKYYYKWCEDNNLKMTGHFMAEDTLISQLQWIGAAMPHYEFMHWPGIDKLGRHTEQLVTVKQVTSVADQLGKERSFCEVFGCVGQQVSFYHRKWIADWQAALGISFVNHHLSLYSMRGERKRDYPANLYYQQPWWDYERRFADYIGRMSYAVSQGKRDVDILVLHPIASVWSEYSPLNKKNNFMVEREVYDKPFASLSKSLMANKFDFHFGDEIIMENHGRVEKGKLVIGQHKYSTVIVPPSLTIRSNSLALLKEFVKSAGPDRLIIMTPCPERLDGVKSSIGWPEGIHIVDSVDEVITQLDKYYKDRIKIIDDITGGNADKIICHQRVSGKDKWVLLVNTDEKREISCTISLPEERTPYILDLASGEAFESNAKAMDGNTIMNVKFHPAGSLLLYYTDSGMQAHPMPTYLDTGIEFSTLPDTANTFDQWEVTVLEQNVLPLNDVTLYLDGELVLHKQPIAKAWHEYFYKAPDGTPFKAEYTFNVLKVPDGEIFAAIEAAENLDQITINGTLVSPLKTKGELGPLDNSKSWKDISFTKVPLTGLLKNGINSLVLEGHKTNNITGPGTHVSVADFNQHTPTEVEAVYLVGDFMVQNQNNVEFAINGDINPPDPKDLTVSGYPFYAGKAQFVAYMDYNPHNSNRVYIKFNNVEAACIELVVNGKSAGIKYWEPYVYDISSLVKEGRNEIKVIASTNLFNLMGPNRISGILEDPFIGPYTFVDFSRYTEKYTLIPFGIGSASIAYKK